MEKNTCTFTIIASLQLDFLPWLIKIVVAMPFCGMYSDSVSIYIFLTQLATRRPHRTSEVLVTGLRNKVKNGNSVLLAHAATSMDSRIPFRGNVLSSSSRVSKL